jgi:putative transposase
MIEELSVKFGIKESCQALGVSRSGYHRWLKREPSEREKEDAELLKQIVKVFEANKERYGSPRVTQQLWQQETVCGENRVARLMRENGLAARRKKAFRPRTTLPGQRAAPNLIKDLEPSAPDQVWVSDITYIGTLEGWLYLAVILDLFSRKVVGWKLGDTLEAELVVTALKNALVRRQPKPGLYFHSDRGSQYSSDAVRKPLAVIGANLSMSDRGNCYDNAKAEAFFSTLKTECFPANQLFATKGEARREIFEYVEVYYNNRRLHSALGYQTPSQYETEFSRVIDIGISPPQTIDVAPEDRALRGRTSSADATLHTAGRAASRRLAGLAVPAGASQSDKSQGVRGTESPDSFNNTLKKTEKLVSVFSGEVQNARYCFHSSESFMVCLCCLWLLPLVFASLCPAIHQADMMAFLRRLSIRCRSKGLRLAR